MKVSHLNAWVPYVLYVLYVLFMFGPAPNGFSQSPPRLGLRVAGGYASVSITGAVSTAWTIQFATNLAVTNFWLPLSSLTLSNTFAYVSDITSPVAGQASGRRFYRALSQHMPTNVVTTNMAWIPPGTFIMGSPTNEPDRGPFEDQHVVTLTHGFFIGKFLVRQGEYLTMVTNVPNPSYFNGVQGTNNYGTDLSRPVEQLSWDGATNYCGLLTLSEQQAGRLPVNWVYRLPTESEWEFACRAGTTNAFSYGDDPGYTNLATYSWYSANSAGMTHDVGQKPRNPWGLYDIHGDVFEWCQDWYDVYPAGPVIDPQGPSDGFDRVFRGGSWNYGGRYCRSAGRYQADPGFAYSYLGFRVVAAPAK